MSVKDHIIDGLVYIPARHGMSLGFQAPHRKVWGPRATPRKRPKRLAKKLSKRGGMLHVRGPLQGIRRAYLKAWPECWWM